MMTMNGSLHRVTPRKPCVCFYVRTKYGDCTQVSRTLRYYASQLQAKSSTRQKQG